MTDRNGAEMKSPWSDLPPEILSNIERLLDSGVDVCRLHSVCKNWHSSRNPDQISLLSPFLPWVISNASLPFTDRSHEPLILVARAVFFVRPLCSSPTSCGWFLTVEEIVPGKLRILYPLSTNRVKHLPSNCPKYLDLSKFRVSQVAKSYVFKYKSDEEDVPSVIRVVCCPGYTAMVLYGDGTIIGLSLKTGNWSFVRESFIIKFSDVISYDGNHVQAIDCRGNVHIIDHWVTKVVKSIFPPEVFPGCNHINLFRVNGQLFVAACFQGDTLTGVRFVIYKLDEAQSRWIDAANKKECNKVLFVSSEWSFFLNNCDVDLCNHSPKPNAKRTIQFGYCKQKGAIEGDYVIYSANSFPCYPGYSDQSRLFKRESLNLGIGVFFLKDGHSSYQKNLLCSTTTDVLWPPPTWFWPDINLSSRNNKELDVYCHNYSLSREKEVLHFSATEASTSITVLNNQGVANSFVPMTQNVDLNHSTVMFERLNIKSSLVPTLQKVWVKYGNILEGSMIRNTYILAKALESLATALLILETSSGRSLDNTQADYLSSVLYDLQHMNFKIDWLVPFVKNALAAHESKPLIDSLTDFNRAKAQAEELKLKLLDELAKLNEVEDMATVSERLLVIESMDFDKNLGEGLY